METPQDLVGTVLGKTRKISTTEKVWGSVEGVYGALVLMQGDAAPAKRMIVTAAIAGGIVYAIRPKSAFDSQGPRPWILTSPPGIRGIPAGAVGGGAG